MTAKQERIYDRAIRIRRGEHRSRKDMAAKIIRVLTTAPILSLVLYTVLYFAVDGFATPAQYAVTLLLYTVLPLTAYPLQPMLPSFRDRGRQGQRTLAMIMANVGYLCSIVYAMFAGVGSALLTLYLTYVFSCTVLLVIDKVFGFHASGHACGLCGPIAALVYFTGWYSFAAGVVLYALVLWGSLRMKRHTVPQFLTGGVVPVVIFLCLADILL